MNDRDKIFEGVKRYMKLIARNRRDENVQLENDYVDSMTQLILIYIDEAIAKAINDCQEKNHG